MFTRFVFSLFAFNWCNKRGTNMKTRSIKFNHTLVYITLILLPFSQIYSQGYKPVLSKNNRWQYLQTDWTTICGANSGKEYFISNDTLVNGYLYKRISYRNINPDNISSQFCPPIHVDSIVNKFDLYLFREDTINKKVFQFDGVNDNLILDFSLSVGDTLFNNYYHFLNNQYPVVDSISYIHLLNNDSSKYFHFNNGTVILEGIGNTCGFAIDSNSTYCDFLICMATNSNNVYSSSFAAFSGCSPRTSIYEYNRDKVELIIRNNIIELKNDENSNIYDFIIYNTLGQIKLISKINSKSKIDVSSFPHSIYAYKLANTKSSLVISGFFNVN